MLSATDWCIIALQVQVTLFPNSLELKISGFVILTGQMSADVKVEGSTWYCGEEVSAQRDLMMHDELLLVGGNCPPYCCRTPITPPLCSMYFWSWQQQQLVPRTLQAGRLFLSMHLNVKIRQLLRSVSQYTDSKMRHLLCHYCADQGVMYMVLLKRNRKGHYADGSTAANTFWYSLLAGGQGADRLQLQHPPNHYYTSPYEADDLGDAL